MTVFVGDDWAEAHRDVHLMNDEGDRLAAGRLPEGLDGIARFHVMVAEHASDLSEVIVGIETERGTRAAEIQTVLRSPRLAAPAAVTTALGATTTALG